jgi:methyl-accepting chemotaxis protein
MQVYNADEELMATYQTDLDHGVNVLKRASKAQSFDPVGNVVLALHPIPSPLDPEEHIGTFALGISAIPFKERIRQFRLAGGVITIVLFLVGNIIAWSIGTNIAKPVSYLASIACQIAEGDLTQSVHLENLADDEIGGLALAFDHMQASLQKIIGHLRAAGLKMQASTDEIFMAVNQLAATAEEQSSSVHETTMTMESMTTTSRQISDNTEAVASMVDQTKTLSQKGTTVAQETIQKMQQIYHTNQRFLEDVTALGERSEKIGSVIQIIHDIADQTKLIAFNAALEAVGTKDIAGRRFNVVAGEIRRLADTIISSTREIETNILEIQQSVRELVASSDATTQRISEGVQQTETTASGLKEILDATIHATDEARQISLAIQEQQRANEQILLALQEISDGTKQFVDASNQVSHSANDMRQLAENFGGLISQFVLSVPQQEPLQPRDS